MFKKTLTTLWALLVTVGIIFPNLYGNLFNTMRFGSTNFPSSADVLTNPGATDSVATVSHSSQHANANDAIEALEAKLGTGASTAVANTLFVGTGAGTSLFSTHATATNIWLSGLLTSANLLSTGSSTIVGSLNITGNSTTTNATTTISAVTGFATTTSLYGAGLTTCSGTTFLQWSGGFFACATPAAGTATFYVATSSSGAQLSLGPISVVAGDKFMVSGQIGQGTINTPIFLYARLANEGASTTLNSFNANGTLNYYFGTMNGYFVATTTGQIYFSVNSSNPQSNAWSNLIVQKFN